MSPSTVVESPTTTERPHAARRGDAAVLAFQRRVKLIDRAARSLISFSGIAIICAVLGIGLFLFLEILPLFQGARMRPGLTKPVLPASQQARLVVVDEHQERALVIAQQPAVHVVSLIDQSTQESIPLRELDGQEISAAFRAVREPTVVLGTRQGEVWIGTIGLSTLFEETQRRIQPVVEPELMVLATPGVPIEHLSYRRDGAHGVIAAIIDQGAHVILTRLQFHTPLVGAERRVLESFPLPLQERGQARAIVVNEGADQVLVGTSTGALMRWQVPEEGAPVLLETVEAIPDGSVSTMAYLLGARSLAIGGSDGSVATWSLVRHENSSDGWRLTRLHPFPSHQAPLTTLAPSPRDKGFISVSEDGVARLHFMTSERTLATFTVGPGTAISDFAPKANGVVMLNRQGMLHHHRIHNPHPEISWRALFGKIWYEGYERPEYVWQSTGGTDDFESKFSLVPLVFGTFKGTCYALFFAVPLALFGALYCSQFLEKRWRSSVKSTIELMAALPSVVLGFVAGVLLAPLVQHHLVAVLMAPVVVALVVLMGVWACRAVPSHPVQAAVRRHEFWMLVGWILIGACVAGWVGPLVEHLAFRGDFEAWLLQTTDTRYDQRNSLVIGWAMGFAVIPIIFTICEDAFSAVPRHLVGASLACGASPWQTAWRVVLPAAGSGVFSAIMIGFGRAVGETMIVLMATGNTPIMEWTIFNGFRALSANIAVEIPEAPYGETLYRVLFIAALLLFTMTFLVNTAAELIRLRLRRQLQGL